MIGESVDAVVRHYFAVFEIVLGSSVEVGGGNVEADPVGGVLKQRPSCVDDFRTDTVVRDYHYFVGCGRTGCERTNYVAVAEE